MEMPPGGQSDIALRRALVASFMPFVARCTRGHSVLDRVAARHQLAAYQLGLLNSAKLAAGGAPVSERVLRDAIPYATRSRFGAEHWQPLIAAGFAREHADGWEITEAGVATVADLYREVWNEVANRTTDAALVGRVADIFEPLSHSVRLTRRAAFLREQWRDVAGTRLVRLYRAIWELSIYRDACFRAAWESEAYTGPMVDVLTQAWQDVSTVEDVVLRLAAKQDRVVVLATLAQLEERRDVESTRGSVTLTAQGRESRDQIENRTELAYFEGWPHGVRLQALRDDFDALMRAVE